MKIAIFLFLILFASGCAQTPVPDEAVVLDVEPVIDYYSLGGYTGGTGEVFFAASGDVEEVKKRLNEIVVGGGVAETTFSEDDALNFVVFRGTFSTGGHGIAIDKVEKAGSTFIVHATYSTPGKGMMVAQAFTQPSAIIPVSKLEEGRYTAVLKVTTKIIDEDAERIIEEDVEHASVSFVVL